MNDDAQTAFLVNAYSDPVIIKIRGRANYMNCKPVGVFFKDMINRGKRTFVMDFADCSAMDSTFLGILAGAAMDLRDLDPPGTLVLARLGARNLDLVRNLGLHHILEVDTGSANHRLDSKADLHSLQGEKVDSADAILQAHENLVDVDQGNLQKFQDVISFLKNQVDDA
ncbi:MAG: STAS domain-containing protein [Opitutales bacterium]